MATTIASSKPICAGDQKRASDSPIIVSATTTSSSALEKPASTSIFQVPNAKRWSPE